MICHKWLQHKGEFREALQFVTLVFSILPKQISAATFEQTMGRSLGTLESSTKSEPVAYPAAIWKRFVSLFTITSAEASTDDAFVALSKNEQPPRLANINTPEALSVPTRLHALSSDANEIGRNFCGIGALKYAVKYYEIPAYHIQISQRT